MAVLAMKKVSCHSAFGFGLALTLAACGGSTPPAESSAPLAVPPPVTQPAPVVSAPPPPPELTAEQKKQQEEEQRLTADRASMEADAEKELARWTPELRQQAKALAERKYPNLKLALDAVLTSPIRAPGHPERDLYRHPRETLTFFGLRPNMTVLEYGPGEGWYTEILAPTLAASGKLLVTNTDPAGPKTSRSTFYAERVQRTLAKSPELFGKVDVAIVDPKQPTLGLENKVDVALVIRGMHGWVQNGQVEAWLSTLHTALKPGGTLGIVQHRSIPGADPATSAKTGYLPEAWVVSTIEAAGFKLSAKSEINANPKDTKDYEAGVWALPPTFRLKDKDRLKYASIGESDRMTLRFVKVPRKTPATAATSVAPKSAVSTPAAASSTSPASPTGTTPATPAVPKATN